MKKRLLCIFTILLMLCGCGKSSGDVVNRTSTEKEMGKKITANELIIASENMNFNFYPDYSIGNNIGVDVLSSVLLNTKEIKVNLNTNVTFSYDIQKMDDKYDFFDYATFNKVDWKRHHNFTDFNGLKKSKDDQKLKESYQNLSENDVNKVYRYRITISFADAIRGGFIGEITTLSLEYKGKKYQKKIGKLSFKELPNKFKESDSLIANELAGTEIPIYPNDKGEMQFSGGEFEATKSIVIKNIVVQDKDCSIDKCSFDFEKNGKPHNQLWKKGVEVPVSKGTKFNLNLLIDNKKFAKKLFCSCNQMIMIQYKYKDKEYIAYCDAGFEKRSGAYELYGILKEGLNFYDYYRYYLNEQG